MPMKKGEKAAEASSKSFASSRLQEQFFKDGDEIFCRFLTDKDEWPVVETHVAVPTKEKPASWRAEANWPKAMGATCANDVDAFQGVDDEGKPDGIWEDGFGTCYIHENYADRLDRFNHPLSNSRNMTYALVVLRERNGTAIRDKTEEWTDAKGNKKQIPAIRVICQPWKSFFSSVAAGGFEDNMVTTRDFRIKKDGRDFTITPLSITNTHHPEVRDNPVLGTAGATPSWKLYAETLELTDTDLEKWIRNRAGEEWMKLWFWAGEWDDKKADTEAENAGSDVAGGSSSVGELSDEEKKKFEEYSARLQASAAKAGS